MRTLSSMIAAVRGQTAEVEGAVIRLRSASRRLTGSTGEAPTSINTIKGGASAGDRVAEMPPLMIQLDAELERLNEATADLRNEISHVESYSETGEESAKMTAYAAQGNAPGYVGSARA